MENRTINLYANNQTLVIDKVIEIVSDTENYIYANVDLGENWQSFDSVRVIWSHGVDVAMVLNNGRCKVPADVIADMGVVKVNLVGSNVENDVLVDRLTTEQIPAILVKQNVPIDGTDPQEITPSQFEQFVEAVKDDADRAEQSASEAETSAQNASDSATSAHNSAQSAHDDKIAIEQAIAEVIQQIEDFEQVQVVVNTLPPSSQATSDFTDGVLTLGIPQGVKGDTGNGIQSIRKTSTSGLVDTYTITYTDGQTTTFTVTNGAKGDTGNGIASIEKTSTVGLVDTYTITYTDGTTTTFTVTNGEKGDKGDTGEVSLSELEDATVVQTLSDNEPYNYRRTNNGNGSGHREYDEIVGASVGWNQLCKDNNNTTEINGVTITNNGDGSFTVNGTASAEVRFYTDKSPYPKLASSHKAFICGCPQGGSLSTYFLAYLNGGGGLMDYANSSDIGSGNVLSVHNSGYQTCVIVIKNGTTVNNLKFKPQFTDLTQMLGSTIADYVYTLEQSTAGSGVTWLRTHFPRLFDNGYQPYDSGSIKSVSGLTAHEMVGKNLFDKSTTIEGKYINDDNGQEASANNNACTDYIGVIGGASYYIKSDQTVGQWGAWYDSNKVFIDGFTGYNRTLTAPQNARYVRLTVERNGNGNRNTFCINLSDPSINGQYFPYEKHTYPLDSSVELRGVPKLDASNNLYYDGDTYESDGTVTRKYGIVDLGTLTWEYQNMGDYYAFASSAILDKAISLGQLANSVCGKYVNSAKPRDEITADKMYGTYNLGTSSNRIVVRDSAYTDAQTFKTAMSGVKLVYELATPTTEQATSYTNPQWCDSKGTEEYIGSELPVGHNTDYPMSLVDTMPTTNGTFEPRVTVTNGVRTVTWVSV